MTTQKSTEGFKNLTDVLLYFSDKKTCEKHLAYMRWEGGKPVCPHCGCEGRIYTMKNIYKCGDCRKQFSVTKGTIFESSHIGLQKWFVAVWLLTSHKKGISSMQLSRDLGVTQKTAWFMLQRLRYAVRTNEYNSALKNEVEIDETYIGGKDSNRHMDKRSHTKGGNTSWGKTPVLGLVERNGKVVAERITSPSIEHIHPLVYKHIEKGATIFTDELRVYRSLERDFTHQAVNHNRGNYVIGNAHTNTIEGFWSLLKRGIIGIYHNISVKHLNKYIDEFEFRYNTREIPCAERFCLALKMSNGRLTYEALTEKWSKWESK